MSDFICGHDGVMRFKKRKARFTFSEIHILLDEVRKNRHIVVGKFNRGVPTEVKKRTWAEITARVNEIGECQREIIEVIKKWSDLKCDTKRKVAAMRAGSVPYRGMNSRLSRDLSPVENIVHQILELDGKRGRLPTSSASLYTGAGLGDEDEGEEEEEEEEVMLGMPSSSFHSSSNGGMDVPVATLPLPAPALGMPLPMPIPMTAPSSASVPLPPASLQHKDNHATASPVYCAGSRETSHPPFEMQYEIPSTEDQDLQLVDSDEENREDGLPAVAVPPNPAEEDQLLTGLRRSAPSANPPPPLPSSSSAAPHPQPRPGPSARERLANNASLSVQEQHTTNVLLETVSRSLELLSESVQQLAETQQEFVRDSLQLQRETVSILRDFASGALALMHDKVNGRPAL